jgi:hypothetical protein
MFITSELFYCTFEEGAMLLI